MSKVFNGRDNAFGVRVYENGVRRVDLTALTRVVVELKGPEGVKTVDSNASAAAFDMAYDDPNGDDVILCSFGEEGIPEGLYSATVIIYEPNNINGLVLTQSLQVQVEDV